MTDDQHHAPIPSTLALRPSSALAAVAAAICRCNLRAGDALPVLDDLARAAGVSPSSLFRCLTTLRSLGVLRSAGEGRRRISVIEDEAALAYASTALGAAELEERARQAAEGGEVNDGARRGGAVTLAELAASVEAMLAEVTTLRAAVSEGVTRAGHAEALAARLAGEVAEMRARLDSGGVAPLPPAPRPLPAAEVEPTAEDFDRLRRLILDAGSHGAAAEQIGSTKNAVWKALRRGSVSPRMAAALRALDGA